MTKSRFSEALIIGMIKQQETGRIRREVIAHHRRRSLKRFVFNFSLKLNANYFIPARCRSLYVEQLR